MVTHLAKRLELVANVAIIVVALTLATVVVKNYLIGAGSRQTPSQNEISTGPTLASVPVNWNQSSRTLVLALSATCRFCSESGPFYKRLADARNDTRLVAVSPQSIEESKKYLAELGISVDEIKQVSLRSLNVTGTPTLILVNQDGAVMQTWIGKLGEDQEAEVLSKIL